MTEIEAYHDNLKSHKEFLKKVQERRAMKNTKPTGIVRVEYIDSGIIDEQTDQIADTHKLIAVGFLVREDKYSVTIAREYDCNENNWRGQIAIPKSVIKYRSDYGQD